MAVQLAAPAFADCVELHLRLKTSQAEQFTQQALDLLKGALHIR